MHSFVFSFVTLNLKWTGEVIYLMSKTQGVLAQSPEPEAHDKVLDNYLDRNSIWKCRFLRRGVNRSTQRESSPSKDENQPLTKPSYDTENGNQTRATFKPNFRNYYLRDNDDEVCSFFIFFHLQPSLTFRHVRCPTAMPCWRGRNSCLHRTTHSKQ